LTEEERARLFEPALASQGAPEDAPDGSRIALWVSQSLVRNTGGDLRLDPVTPRGSRFVVELPTFDSGAAGEPRLPIAPEGGRSDGRFDTGARPDEAPKRRGVLARIWLEYVQAIDEHEARRTAHPVLVWTVAGLMAASALGMGLLPGWQAATGMRHPYLLAAGWLLCGALAMVLRRVRGPWFRVLVLVALAGFSTLCVGFALSTTTPVSHLMLFVFMISTSLFGARMVQSWPVLLVSVAWPFALSLWGWPDAVFPMLVGLGGVGHFLNIAGTGRERWLRSQRDAALQAQLGQSNQLASLGRISAGLAHELEQHVRGVRALAQELQGEASEQPGSRDVDFIVSAAERMGHIIDNVQRLSRRERLARAPIDVLPPVRLSYALVESQLVDLGIRTKWSGGPGPGPLATVDPVELEQVLLNLLLNAKDALRLLPEGRPRELQIGVVEDGARVRIIMEDSGPGVPEENRAQLFDPGFTTKEADAGTGIGLWISRSLLLAAGGDLRFEPVPSGGARFVVEVPAYQPRAG
jgi:signal transduction histidine kinase